MTSKELWVIEAIVSNEFSGYNYHLPEHTVSYDELRRDGATSCWANSIEDNGAKHGTVVAGKEISGVVGSLVKKGYVYSCGTGRDATVTVTEAGWAAYQKDIETFFVNDQKAEENIQAENASIDDAAFCLACMTALGVTKFAETISLPITTKEAIHIKLCEEVAKAMLLNKLASSDTEVLRVIQVRAYTLWN